MDAAAPQKTAESIPDSPPKAVVSEVSPEKEIPFPTHEILLPPIRVTPDKTTSQENQKPTAIVAPLPFIEPGIVVQPKTPQESKQKISEEKPLVDRILQKAKAEADHEVGRRLTIPDEVHAPIVEHYVPTKEEAKKTMVETIDSFLAKDRQDSLKEPSRVVHMRKETGKIVLGAQGKESEAGKQTSSEQHLEPIATADELVQVLNLLDKIFPREEGLVVEEGRERRLQVEDTPEISLLVSKDVLQFLEQGNMLFEVMDRSEEKKEAEEMRMVRVASEEKEVLIEVTRLKKLIELVKIRKHMLDGTFTLENWAIPEELGLHGLSYQNDQSSYEDFLLWLALENKILFLAGADDNQLADYYPGNASPTISA